MRRVALVVGLGALAACASIVGIDDVAYPGPGVGAPSDGSASGDALASGNDAYGEHVAAPDGPAVPEDAARGPTTVYLGGDPHSVAVDNGVLYWSDYAMGAAVGGKVLRCPLPGCQPPPETVALVTLATRLTAKADHVAWLWKGGLDLADCTRTPCTGAHVSSGPVFGFAATSTTLFWTSQSAISWCPLAMCPGTAAANKAQAPSQGLAASSKSAYVGQTSNILSCNSATECASPVDLVAAAAVDLVAADDTDLAVHTIGEIWTCPVNDAANCRTSRRTLTTTSDAVRSLAVDRGAVYWAEGSSILTCTIGGFCGAQHVADNEGVVRGLALDSAYVYWTVAAPNGAVRRAAR